MRLERLSLNKIKYSISFDELSNKGLVQHDIWKQPFFWEDLFDEMLDEAQTRFQLDTIETVAIEIYSFTSEELILIVTIEHEESDLIEESIEFEQLLLVEDETESVNTIFLFESLEDLLELAKCLQQLQISTISKLFMFKQKYYLQLEMDANTKKVSIICEEYARVSTISEPIITEYGTSIFKEKALESLLKHFK